MKERAFIDYDSVCAKQHKKWLKSLLANYLQVFKSTSCNFLCIFIQL